MNRIRFLSIFLLLMLLNGWVLPFDVQAQSDEDLAYQLLGSTSTLFPRLLIDNQFQQTADPLIYYERDAYCSLSVVKNGVLKAVMFNESPDLTERGRSAFYAGTNYGTLAEFHLHVEATLVAEFPENSGYCFVQYTNGIIVDENSRESVTINVGQEADAYKTYSGNRKYTTLKDLRPERQIGKTVIVDIIRLNGVGYLFTDGTFIAKYEDGIQTNLTWMIGAGTSEGGEQATCIFDNLQLRRK